VGAGLVLITGLARAANVEVPGLEGGISIDDIYGAAFASAALEPDVAEIFLLVVDDAEYLVDNLGRLVVAPRLFVYTDDIEVLLCEAKRLDEIRPALMVTMRLAISGKLKNMIRTSSVPARGRLLAAPNWCSSHGWKMGLSGSYRSIPASPRNQSRTRRRHLCPRPRRAHGLFRS
jgi:hypothetical protein